MGSALSTDEATELQRHEAVIAQGLTTFIDVGRALLAIRNNDLHRETHDTFEDYCRERWGLRRRHAYRMMDAAKVAVNLCPIGHTPETESQARPLTKLPPDLQCAAWSDAVASAPNGKPTARIVEASVARLAGRAEPEPVPVPDPDEPVVTDDPEPDALPFAPSLHRAGAEPAPVTEDAPGDPSRFADEPDPGPLGPARTPEGAADGQADAPPDDLPGGRGLTVDGPPRPVDPESAARGADAWVKLIHGFNNLVISIDRRGGVAVMAQHWPTGHARDALKFMTIARDTLDKHVKDMRRLLR